MTYLASTHVEKYSLLSESTLSSSSLLSESKKIIASEGMDYVTPSSVDTLSHSIQCNDGVDFILTHLEEPVFPRDIMTKKLGHKIEVFNKKSVLCHFEQSNYQDCRISAYPRLTGYKGINLVAPNFIMIDIDLSVLGTELVLAKALKITLNRIYKILQTRPTVLWTGNGYHIYLPIKAFVLEEEEVFAKFQNGKYSGSNLSTKFIRFAEAFFTNNKHDPQHRPSVNSCLLRVPSTHNSKSGQYVSILQKWDGSKPDIRYVLRDFRRYLIQNQLDEINEQSMSKAISQVASIRWIEQLLQTPVADYRRYCVWRILAPYATNIRKVSDKVAYSVIITWLQKCNSIRKLTFNPRYILKQNIHNARRIGYYPIGWNALKIENSYLHKLLGHYDNPKVKSTTRGGQN
jgi:hypothetical protein